MVEVLKNMGHKVIDINLGCPFPPIALHHKGSGLLQYPGEVEKLFVELKKMEGVNFSVKMRLGWDSPSQWREIMPLLSIIEPLKVTIHPRTGRHRARTGQGEHRGAVEDHALRALRGGQEHGAAQPRD